MARVAKKKPEAVITTVRVSRATKEILDRLRDEAGAETMDELLYDIVREKIQPELGLNLPPRRRGLSEFEIDISHELKPLEDRVAKLEAIIARLGGDQLLVDPEDGRVFDSRKCRAYVEGSLFDGLGGKKGIHLEAPSECRMWEQKGELPEEVVARIKREKGLASSEADEIDEDEDLEEDDLEELDDEELLDDEDEDEEEEPPAKQKRAAAPKKPDSGKKR